MLEKKPLITPNSLNGSNQDSPPHPDQIEVTLIGPGYGECVCIHIGAGEWIVVDSCINSGSTEPASVTYLNSIGVDPGQAVKLLVATHWHDDHCRGLSKSLEAFGSAQFVMASVLSRDEFSTFASGYDERPTAKVGSKVTEINQVFTALTQGPTPRRKVRRASQGRVLLSTITGSTTSRVQCCVTALSPSDLAESDFLARLAEEMPSIRRTKKAAPDISPNDASVALWVEVGDRAILLGADLEESGHPERGWSAILDANNLPVGKADLFKVSHHGSSNGHHPELWKKKLKPGSLAALTPWSRNKGLPTSADIRRLDGFTKGGFATAKTFPNSASSKPAIVRSYLRQQRLRLRSLNEGFGMVRFRTSPHRRDGAWCIELFDGACNIINLLTA
ncbi:MBL fold metallo-hydrolase [Acidisphaera sp. L21]|uniref:MBL fold metallo-hydrolase n=1 Tax=Acidisphaera sp. L21 TaxID=1641851 RepID=UPI00131B1794|nr:MBL fold metallo-hydrolase [Acidisphaera sp. L21]